jgi:hypothetical protein
MTSTLIMKIFLVEYIICAGFCVKEGNYPRTLYWIMAAGLNWSIIWGMK